MPKCKMAYCREEAVPGGKRYCSRHKAEYLAKQRAYAARPNCASRVSPQCSGKAGQDQLARGWTICRSCENFDMEQRYEQQAEASKREARLDSIMDNLTSDCFSDYQLEQLRAAFNSVLEFRYD